MSGGPPMRSSKFGEGTTSATMKESGSKDGRPGAGAASVRDAVIMRHTRYTEAVLIITRRRIPRMATASGFIRDSAVAEIVVPDASTGRRAGKFRAAARATQNFLIAEPVTSRPARNP